MRYACRDAFFSVLALRMLVGEPRRDVSGVACGVKKEPMPAQDFADSSLAAASCGARAATFNSTFTADTFAAGGSSRSTGTLPASAGPDDDEADDDRDEL